MNTLRIALLYLVTKFFFTLKTIRWYIISKIYHERLEEERFMILANYRERSKTLFRFEVKNYPYKKYKSRNSYYSVKAKLKDLELLKEEVR